MAKNDDKQVDLSGAAAPASKVDAPAPAPKADPPAPPPKEEPPVEVAAPAPKQYPKFVKAVHKFPWPMPGGGVCRFEKDYVFSDPILVKHLLDNNGPVVPVEQDVDFHICSKCFNQDPVDLKLRDKIVKARAEANAK